jgi:hypothetical protein
VSSTYDLPLNLETTYDILKFPSYELSTYASVFHLAAMKATAVLARHPLVKDESFAATCDAAFAKAQLAMDQLQWVAASNTTGVHPVHLTLVRLLLMRPPTNSICRFLLNTHTH